MFFARSLQKEMMDDESIQGETLEQILRELSLVHRWLGGRSVTLEGIKNLTRNYLASKTLTILDIGTGGGDIVNAIPPEFTNVKITALDFNPAACQYASRQHPSLTVVEGSVLALPFQPQSFDIVHASLFLHHFTEDEIIHIVQSAFSIARHGIIINDLRRSVFAYLGIAILTRFFSRSWMVKHDAPLSVRKGFTKYELQALCGSLSPVSIKIYRRWAFRWLVCIQKQE